MKAHLTAALLGVLLLAACSSSSYRSSYPVRYSYLTDEQVAQIQASVPSEISGEAIAELLELEPSNVHRHDFGSTWVWVEFVRSGQRSLSVQFSDGKAISSNLYEE